MGTLSLKRLRLRLLLPTIVGAMMWALFASTTLRSQTRDTSASARDTIDTVNSLDDLVPRTSEEKRRAELYNTGEVNIRQRFGPRGFQIVTFTEPDDIAPLGASAPNAIDKSAEDKSIDRICGSDAIVIGTLSSRRVLMTKKETWLFTDYRVAVREWIKPQRTSREVVFSRLGGEVLVDGKLVRLGESGDTFAIRPGQPAVFFLGYLSNTVIADIAFGKHSFDESLGFYSYKGAPALLPTPDQARSDYIADIRQKSDSCTKK